MTKFKGVISDKNKVFPRITTVSWAESYDGVQHDINYYLRELHKEFEENLSIEIVPEQRYKDYYAKYYADTYFTIDEIDNYNRIQANLHNFCSNNNINWRGEIDQNLGGYYNPLSNKELVQIILHEGLPVNSEWLEIVNSRIEEYFRKNKF